MVPRITPLLYRSPPNKNKLLDLNITTSSASYVTFCPQYPSASILARETTSDKMVTLCEECRRLLAGEWVLVSRDGHPGLPVGYLHHETAEALRACVAGGHCRLCNLITYGGRRLKKSYWSRGPWTVLFGFEHPLPKQPHVLHLIVFAMAKDEHFFPRLNTLNIHPSESKIPLPPVPAHEQFLC